MLFGSNQMLWSFVLAFPMNNNDTCVIKVSIDVIDWCSTKQNLANALYHSSDCDSIGLLLTSNWFLDSLHFTWNVTVTSLRISMLRLLNNPWLSSSVCTLQRWNNWSFPCTLFFLSLENLVVSIARIPFQYPDFWEFLVHSQYPLVFSLRRTTPFGKIAISL